MVEEPNLDTFWVKQELAAHRKALRRVQQAFVVLAEKRPELRPELNKISHQIQEDLCWND